MTRLQARLLHFGVLTLTLTGVVFAWMKYFGTSEDEFAVSNHPWQPTMLHLHVISAPLLVFAFGWIFDRHVLQKLRGGARRRKSGIGALAIFLPMVASGYLLQVLTDQQILRASAVTHWVTSAFFVLIYVVHLVTRPPREKNGAVSVPQ